MKENISFKLTWIEMSSFKVFTEILIENASKKDYTHKLMVACLKSLHKKLIVKTAWNKGNEKIQLTAAEALAFHEGFIKIISVNDFTIQSIINKINQAYA
jgi:hypothetical protein